MQNSGRQAALKTAGPPRYEMCVFALLCPFLLFVSFYRLLSVCLLCLFIFSLLFFTLTFYIHFLPFTSLPSVRSMKAETLRIFLLTASREPTLARGSECGRGRSAQGLLVKELAVASRCDDSSSSSYVRNMSARSRKESDQ